MAVFAANIISGFNPLEGAPPINYGGFYLAGMLLVLAGLVSVPTYLYEAAAVDRATPWQRFKTVTFPYIKGLLLLALLFRTIETFKLFDAVYIITAGGPGSSTETIAVYVYRVAFQYFKTSEASAISYILLFVVIVLTNLYLYFVNQREAGN